MSSLLGQAQLGHLPLANPGLSPGPTPYLSLCESVAAYLATVSSLDLTLAVNLFDTFIPDAPDQMVTVLERPGAASLLTFTGMGQPQSILDQPAIQIRVRAAANGYSVGNALTQQVFGALQGLANTQLPTGGMTFLLLAATGYPAYLGTDSRQRPEWSLTMRVLLQNAQRILA